MNLIDYETPADALEDLKANWLADPCWDIEETEGFEAFHEELLAFRLQQEAIWTQERAKRCRTLALSWGIHGHVCSDQERFGERMQALLTRIEHLEKRITQLENPGEIIW